MGRSAKTSALFTLIAACTLASAQSPEPAPPLQPPHFAVISIRPTDPASSTPKFEVTRTGLIEHGNSVFWLIAVACGIPSQDRLLNAPAWVFSSLYDVSARIDEADLTAWQKLTRQEQYTALKQVLEERFALKFHFIQKSIPKYALIPAKGGPKLHEAKMTDPSNPPHSAGITGRYQLTAQGISMPELSATWLSTEARREVVDQTGMKGSYDFILNWSRDESGSGQQNASYTTGPSIFTAVQEQLGLKLVPITAPAPFLVIDKIERPTEN